MKAFVAVLRREIVERRPAFGAALLAALIPFAVPIARGLHGTSAREARETAALLLAAGFAAVLSAALGWSVLARDLADRRLGFYFSRPLSGFSIWAGKMAAAFLLAIGSAVLVWLPSHAVSAGQIALVDLPGWAPWAVIGGSAFLLVSSHAAGVALRSRSALLGLDVAFLLLAVAAAIAVAESLRHRGALVPLRAGALGFLATAMLGLIAAGIASVTRGRTDIRSAHRALSVRVWIGLAAAAAGFAGYAGWVLSAGPADLSIIGLTPASRGPWIAVDGEARAAVPSGAGRSRAVSPLCYRSRPVTTGFFRSNGELTCDGVPLSELAGRFGTPLYVYSWARIEENFRRFDTAFAEVSHLVCYATKANSSLAILRRLASLGSGADVVSGGELRAALECGIPADRIVFSGVGKTGEEMAQAVDAQILAFNAESEREIEKIDEIARGKGTVARVALRVNPDIDARSHPYISTGLKRNKFGVDISRTRQIFEKARRLSGIRMTGLQAHIGSQIVEAEPLVESARELAALASALAKEGFSIENLDIGGGIGIEREGLSPEAYAAALLPFLRGLPFRILIEPGRAIAGPAGVLLTRVLYVKEEAGKNFVVTDAGMNDLIRPALYQAIHPIESVAPSGGQNFTADVVGPVCETSDSFLRDAELARPLEGDLLAIRDTGAYGFAMASNYNFRPRAAEVLVESGRPILARRRETFEDLTRLEHV